MEQRPSFAGRMVDGVYIMEKGSVIALHAINELSDKMVSNHPSV